MKRLLCLALALCLLCGCALAETEYAVLPFELDEDAALETAFGPQKDSAQKTVYDEAHFAYLLPDESKSACYNTTRYVPVQNELFIYTMAYNNDTVETRNWDNVVPSGIAACGLTREAARDQAETYMAQLALGEHTLQMITAYGQHAQCTPCYKISLLQTLNGKPVYWSAASHSEELFWPPETNRMDVVLGDAGLLSITGHWCRYEPIGSDRQTITQEQAVAALAAIGEAAEQAEACYLMSYDGQAATAVPAYRWQNRFVNALTGAVMQ